MFEQRDDGTLDTMQDSALEGALSAPLQDAEEQPVAAEKHHKEAILRAKIPGGAVILDAPADEEDLAVSRPVLPKPRGMGTRLSGEQRAMRRMAAEVALAYSRRPGVVRAKLDQATFITLFTTMIRRESNFNPRAVSPVGAKGLGQLMPLTAREVGVCDVFSPRDNLEGAATYFTSMLNRFGSAPIALAAYNAGPTAVAKHRGIPPYRETRQYVADIMAAARMPSEALPDVMIDLLSHTRGKPAGLDNPVERQGEGRGQRRCRPSAAATVLAED